MKVLVCFDGSPGAEHAVAEAGRLFPGMDAVVAHAWQPPLPIALAGGGVAYSVANEVEQNLVEQAEQHADALARRGVDLATAAGLLAQPLVLKATGAIWGELLRAADEHGVDVLVVGSRGWGEVRALVLGSTSAGLVFHSRRPVVVVPGRDA